MAGTGVERVTVERGGEVVLRDLTLLADDGELMVVLGASGSGKSTLLRVIAGLDGVSAGEVLIGGRRVTGVPAGRRRVAMVFQVDVLLSSLDVAGNLGLGLRLQRRPETEVEERVGRRARQLGLDRLRSRRPGQLSGGERGLVGIGRALVQAPDVFLLDEPLGDLDAAQRVEVRRRIVEVVRSHGATAFYVTDDPDEGLAVADRVALLHEGRVVQVGRPREVYERPADLFVAEFIGTPTIGLLPARLVSVGGQAGYEVGRRTLPLWQEVPLPLQGQVGRRVLLGFRAQDVHGPEAGCGPDAVTLDAVVTAVEYTGRHDVLAAVVDAPSPGSRSGATLHALFPPGTAPGPGQAVRIAVEGARAHVFDPVTGRALWHPADAAGAPPVRGPVR